MTYPINTLRIEHVNTQRIAFVDTPIPMTETKAERLRLAREQAGFKSASEAAREFGWTDSAYRHHENGTRGFGADAAKKYGRAFRVKPSWLLGMASDLTAPAEAELPPENILVVLGEVAAGVWREPTEEYKKRILDIAAPVPGAARFGLAVNGYSMDEFYKYGTVLDCVSIFSENIKPETGDHVIVERIKPDGLRELTVKEFIERDGEYWLRAHSSRPEFRQDIHIGSPTEGHVGEDEVRVIGFVVSSIPPAALRTLIRMGKMRTIGYESLEHSLFDT